MSNKILFGIEPNNLKYIVSGIRNLAISVNNRFFTDSTINSQSNFLLHEESYINVECVSATSKDTAILQSAAISAKPIYCQISCDNVSPIYGGFVISQLEIENTEGEIGECSFKLKSTGPYEVK
jgi:hypothetical protein